MQCHCRDGVYYGGSFIVSAWPNAGRKFVVPFDVIALQDIEEAAKVFCGGDCGSCGASTPCAPRSRSARIAGKKEGGEALSYDVVIVGAGCIGGAVARELSRYDVSVLLVEAAGDVAAGATKGNSGVIHAGYNEESGSVRAQYCWKGNQMFPQLDRELRFGFMRNGSLVVATCDEELATLERLKKRGETNGVQRLRIVGKKELFEMEPNLSPLCVGALFAPDAGTVIPFEYAIALAENAVDNGVELRLRRELTKVQKQSDGRFELTLKHWEPKAFVEATAAGPRGEMEEQVPPPVGEGSGKVVRIEDMVVGGSDSARISDGLVVGEEKVIARCVINCAGSGSAKVARMIGDESFTIKQRLGEYLLLHRSQGNLVQRTIFPCPGPLGKGVLVQRTLWGQLILGPTARDIHHEDDLKKTPAEIHDFIISNCRRLVPGFNVEKSLFHAFRGARARCSHKDWIIEPSRLDASFVHVAGIDSPGLAASPAIAIEVARLIGNVIGPMKAKSNFNPNRRPTVFPKHESLEGLQFTPYEKRFSTVDRRANVVCKCERVTEFEVVDSLHRSLPVDSTQAVRRRTRAGMGPCQGDPANYNCECRVAEIVARELRIPVAAVGRRPWPATSTLSRRWLSDEDKKAVAHSKL